MEGLFNLSVSGRGSLGSRLTWAELQTKIREEITLEPNWSKMEQALTVGDEFEFCQGLYKVSKAEHEGKAICD
jgi:hypothetical protein